MISTDGRLSAAVTVRPVLLLDVVGLTLPLLKHMPRLRGLAGTQTELDTVLPAVTCSVQSTFLTGLLPGEHGIVGNGWYSRELGEVFLWRQHNGLVAGEKLWETARAARPGYRAANLCWWYAMGASTDITITPRPVYHADGRKSPDCYVRPPALHDELTAELGAFPLFHYWGPNASIASSRWIIAAARRVLRTARPELTMVYVPHLDYDLQRFGPSGPQAAAAAAELDVCLAPILEDAHDRSVAIVVVSEYGMTEARHPIDINRALRYAGLLEVYTQKGMEYLDPWTSRAFAVADHQIAHVYVRDSSDVTRVHSLVAGLPGVDEVLDREAQGRHGLDHPRAGELVAVAEPEAWFTYYYWLDDAQAPDFAHGVEIHRKPGYDPAELFFDPCDTLVKARAGLNLIRKRVGLRYTMRTAPLDPSCVRGTHGRRPDTPAARPVLLCSDDVPGVGKRISATDIRALVLALQGLPIPAR
jgi:predicted AlkP superfamily pyrophosphatase or phosphodiesterase